MSWGALAAVTIAAVVAGFAGLVLGFVVAVYMIGAALVAQVREDETAKARREC